jgi:16S rRNA (cytosine1407-C5)-methyltransferase
MEKTNFLQKFMKITGLNKLEALKVLNINKCSVLILNTLNANSSNFDPKLYSNDLMPIDDYKDVYLITGEKSKFTKNEAFTNGYYYIQNLASLLPVQVLNPKADEKVLDMCAAPGGKSFNICRLTDNKARLSVNESERHRARDLSEIIKTYNMNVENEFFGPGQGLFRKVSTKFNKILLDAPCSAEGLISNLTDDNPKYWNQKKVKQLRNLQKKLINSAYHMLEDEGTLVYSTCTFSPEENEEVVSWLLDTYKDVKIAEIEEFKMRKNFVPALRKWENKVFNEYMQHCIRIIPDEIYEGFFVAKLVKTSK